MSTLKSVFDAQKSWCDNIGSKHCRTSRNLTSDKCKLCCFDYIKAQLGMESFGVDPNDEVASRPIVNLGGMPGGPGPMDELIEKIESGEAKKSIPVNTQLLIDGTMWVVVDHDHVPSPGRRHTMTIRSIPTEYPAYDYRDSVGGEHGFEWCKSALRKFLNESIFEHLPAALRGAALPVTLKTIVFKEVCRKCGSSECKCSTCPKILKPRVVESQDKVWIPSISQCMHDTTISNIFTSEDTLAAIRSSDPLLDMYDITVFPSTTLSIQDKDGNELTWWLRDMFREDNDMAASNDGRIRGILVSSAPEGYNVVACPDFNNLGYVLPHITI